ncbi:hypothetical protein F5B22DRAFT_285910 [Xylaria bambusicola]|uniref:uncharacterized protein n=1 Tax=Xylaria bambusicola TaxID=326684 RepID=UPI00200856B4|nr:uncharacterized protein F5B22DRAFT_285910 [Xylaria bambusicola]KAI0513066.1 hypothetical protein F5B22DRAFT_285910 [Xylaria bambusicola]
MGRLQGRYAEVQDQSLDSLEERYEVEGFGYHSQYHNVPNPTDLQHNHESRAASRSSERQYKPTALKWPFLITLLLALLTTLAFLSYAVTSLPVVGSNDTSEHVQARGLYQPSDIIHAVKARDTTESISSSPAQTTPSGSDDGTTTEPPMTKEPGDYGKIGTQTVTVEPSLTPTTKPSSNFGDIGTKTVTEADPTITTPPGDSDGSDSASQTPTFAPSKDQSDFGRIGTVTISEETNDTSETPLIESTRAQTDYGNIGTVTVTETPPTSTPTVSETAGKPPSDYGDIGSKTVSEQHPGSLAPIETVTHVTLGVTILTDEKGSVIATSTETPTPITSLETSTLTNSDGDATATQVVTVMISPSLSVKTDSAGNPTATIATYPIPPTVRTAVYSINASHYFMGKFLTTVVASILAIAVRILDTNAKSFQPWHALTHDQGAPGRDSLCLDTGGWRSLLMGLRSLVGGHAVVFLVSLLSLSSALLVPVSAGAVTLDLRGDGCKIGGSTASNCAYVLSVAPMVAKATLGILGVMSLATLFLVVMIGRWRLGVYTNPWGMCTLASLSTNPDVRRLVVDATTGPDAKHARKHLSHHDFKLDYFRNTKGQIEYGVVALDRFKGTGLSPMWQNEKSPLTSNIEDREFLGRKHSSPFFMLGIVGRLCLFLFLSGVLVLVLYYARTGGDTAFERFIDSDSFGVEFLFTGLGVVISILWFGFLGAVSTMNSYQYLSERPREASKSILLAPPTNAFSGLWHSIRTRRFFLGVVSLASILSESLGIFLGNVRFQVTQTFFVNQLCIWAAVGIMSFMLLILLASFFLKWPHMPVDPSTIAGAMYYVCDDSVVDKFEGLSTLNKKERDRAVTGMALLYDFSERMSIEGGNRVGLNILDTKVFMP